MERCAETKTVLQFRLPPIKRKKCAFMGNSFGFTLGKCIFRRTIRLYATRITIKILYNLIPDGSNDTWRICYADDDDT